MALNISVAVLSILYVPMLYYLKDMHDYKAYEEEEEEGILFFKKVIIHLEISSVSDSMF